MQPPPIAHVRFWRWFQANADRLHAAVSAGSEQRQQAFDEVDRALASVAEGIHFDFGGQPPASEKEFVLSPDGRREHVDTVKGLAHSAPPMPGWRVIAFRPRLGFSASLAISLGGEKVSPQDIWFQATPHEDVGFALTLSVRGLTKQNERLRGLAACLLLDHGLGEADSLSLVFGLEVEPLTGDPDAQGLRPLTELVAFVDAFKLEQFPPPGQLAVDLQGAWSQRRGTMNDLPAYVFVNGGLRRVMGHPAYDRRLLVSIPFQEIRPDGMPATEREFTEVQQAGEQIAAILQEGQESLLAAMVLHGGRRDLIFYTSNPGAALERLEKLRSEGSGQQLDLAVELETFWETYRKFSA